MAISSSDIASIQAEDLTRRTTKRAKKRGGNGKRRTTVVDVRRQMEIDGAKLDALHDRLNGLNELEGVALVQAASRLKRDACGVSHAVHKCAENVMNMALGTMAR